MMSTVVLSVSHRQWTISPSFYAKLLRSVIPNAQKILSSCQSFCAFGICVRKSFSLNVGEIDSDRDVLVKLLYLAFYSADERF